MHWQASDRRITATDAVERFAKETFGNRQWKWVDANAGLFCLLDGIKLYRVTVTATGITIVDTDNSSREAANA